MIGDDSDRRGGGLAVHGIGPHGPCAARGDAGIVDRSGAPEELTLAGARA